MTVPKSYQPADLFALNGRIALVTGASRGMGREIARAYAAAGATVLVNSRSHANVEAVCGAIAADGGAAHAFAFDVADDAARTRAFADIDARWGHIDVLVNNVGMRFRATVDKIDLEIFRRMLETNLTAAYALTRLALPAMQRRRFGRIVNISSIAAHISSRADVAYSSAKGGMDSLTRSIAAEFGDQGITCNAIAPGFFATETNAPAVAEPFFKNFVELRIPTKRWARADEIVTAALFLAAPASSFVNGHVLVVDGGMTASF